MTAYGPQNSFPGGTTISPPRSSPLWIYMVAFRPAEKVQNIARKNPIPANLRDSSSSAVFGTYRSAVCFRVMRRFTYNFTDLTTYESPSLEVWIDGEDLQSFAARVAHEMLDAVPTLVNKGMCVGIYDQQGEAVSYVPLDTLH